MRVTPRCSLRVAFVAIGVLVTLAMGRWWTKGGWHFGTEAEYLQPSLDAAGSSGPDDLAILANAWSQSARASATVNDCTHVWMAFRRWRIPTAILNPIPTTVFECQKMCEVNGSCVSVDFNVQGQCFMSFFGPGYGNNTDDPPGVKEDSFINYRIQRTCPSDDADNTVVARYLHESVRVLCMVVTPHNLDTDRGVHLMLTWGRRCNRLLFFSDKNRNAFPVPVVHVNSTGTTWEEKYTSLTVGVFDYVFQNHFDEADWFLKINDENFVIMENLRHFLHTQKTSEPVYFGRRQQETGQLRVFNMDEAGYVLSKNALRRIANRPHTVNCESKGNSVAVSIGLCFHELGIRVGDSTDELNRERFHLTSPDHVFFNLKLNSARELVDVLSDSSISFHKICDEEQYEMEMYVYHLKTYYRAHAEL